VYHGGGGFKHEEVYNMPTWMRQFHLKKINAFLKEQKEAQEKALKQNSQPLSKTISGPNVNPSAVYNFKK
tara:strand:+ start:1202 stop:1411 length:210 start_codon:yes stop_codon:yes gene_type:complete